MLLKTSLSVAQLNDLHVFLQGNWNLYHEPESAEKNHQRYIIKIVSSKSNPNKQPHGKETALPTYEVTLEVKELYTPDWESGQKKPVPFEIIEALFQTIGVFAFPTTT